MGKQRGFNCTCSKKNQKKKVRRPADVMFWFVFQWKLIRVVMKMPWWRVQKLQKHWWTSIHPLHLHWMTNRYVSVRRVKTGLFTLWTGWWREEGISHHSAIIGAEWCTRYSPGFQIEIWSANCKVSRSRGNDWLLSSSVWKCITKSFRKSWKVCDKRV